MRRLWYVMWKELLELRQDPRLFSIIFIAPVIQLTLLGYAASTDVKDVPLLVVDQMIGHDELRAREADA